MIVLYLFVLIQEKNIGLDKDYILIIEGSCHKLMFGQNAYNGFYDLEVVVRNT